MNNKPRKFNGFGVVTSQGRFLWRYSRITEAEAQAAYENHNPQVEGHPDGHQIVKISLFIEPSE